MPLLGTNVDPMMLVGMDFPRCCFNFDGAPLCVELRSVSNDLIVDAGYVISRPDIPVGAMNVLVGRKPPRCIKQFDEIERAGTVVAYRCVDCRGCLGCKNGARIDAVSIQEEVGQAMIQRALRVDIDECRSRSKLSFVMADPDRMIMPNEHDALNVYREQIRSLSTRPNDRLAVIEYEKKLQELGCRGSDARYFIPWRAVFNERSPSTPCRLVFDASQGRRG